MDEDGALFDSAFDDGGPFRVTPEAGGVSLASALRDYGPAAIDDLIPRLRAIAHILDAAHAAGHVHGALHPSKVIVHDDATSIVAGRVPIAPYAAPELADGPATPASDQYGFAAIAYEWMFGRPIDHPADRPVEVRTLPGVDRVTLSKAYTRALAPNPAARFASCSDFCSALANAVVPELPLLALDADDDPVGPFIAETLDRPAANVDDIKIVGEEPLRDAALLAQHRQPDFDVISPQLAEPVITPVASWNPGVSSPPPRSRESERFGAFALILATVVGAIFGFAAGYMAKPRALQSAAPAQIAVAPGTEAPITGGQGAPRAPSKAGRLLVRSTPSGASVSVDGIAKGVTPLALRDLDLGTRSVVITRPGYLAESRKVVITNARPSRSLDVRLAAEAAASTAAAAPKQAAPRASEGGPATLGKPATSSGGLSIDSRPTGAAVTINGKPGGNTPLTIDDLPPGEYRILMALPGYRNFATTVRVVAGERARAAASLTALEQQ